MIDSVIFLITIAMHAAASLFIYAPYVAPTYAVKHFKFARIFVFPVVFILPLYGLSLLVHRVLSLLKIGVLDCGYHKLKRKMAQLSMKSHVLHHDHYDEYSPLLK